MGRGGPLEPEVIDPRHADLTPAGLLALADSGRHAASDHLEDALTAGVVTIGTRRCGGGLAGAPVDSTFAAGVTLANGRSEPLLVFEGSGSAIPPAHADATICVVPATADPELVTGYLGAYRMLLADLVVVTMAEQSLADSGAVTSLERDVRGLAPGGVVRTIFRPFPLEPISGRRIFFATTATPQAMNLMVRHLEDEHGGQIVGTSHHLSNRQLLQADLEAAGDAEALVVELKAAAVDLATRVALERGWDVIFYENRVLTVDGDAPFEDVATSVADLATERFS
jgi:cyclic 2,3-diphosphoglycerate synthetase